MNTIPLVGCRQKDCCNMEIRKDIPILITGCAGFIGFHFSKLLLSKGYKVLGIDNLNDYYDVNLKLDRLKNLEHENFTFIKGDISCRDFINKVFSGYDFEIIVHLAAQAGVRYSFENPRAYIDSNIYGFFNILEGCRDKKIKHLLYASSSSVYGNNKKVPFSETDFVDNPASLYAATKKSNELFAYTYSHLFNIPATGLRFFTVYGPFGRPDMAYFNFTDRYFRGEEIRIFNNGDFEHDLYRDFTYIDDITNSMYKLLSLPPKNSPPHEIYNIGNNQPEKLMDFIFALENALSRALGRKVEFKKVYEPLKPGDVPKTYADIGKLYEKIGFRPKTKIEDGLYEFAKWYVSYYKKS